MFTFSRRFYPKRLTIGEYIKRLISKRQTDRVSARNTKSQALFKYVWASNRRRERSRERSRFWKSEIIIYIYIYIYIIFFLWWSQVELKEISFQLLLEDWQGSSIPDGDGKIIPPARNGERECSGEWFWASLWWYYEASLTSRSQTSGGDVDS